MSDFPPVILPEVSRTLILTGTVSGEFMGQATFWKRDGRWECVGCQKRIRWLSEVPFEGLAEEIKGRGLSYQWKESIPFVVRDGPIPVAKNSYY